MFAKCVMSREESPRLKFDAAYLSVSCNYVRLSLSASRVSTILGNNTLLT